MLAPALEPIQEIQEIETALARAERLAGEARLQRRSSEPFDFEQQRGDGGAGAAGPFDFEHETLPSRASERVVEREPSGQDTELFDVERETPARAA